MSDKLEPCPYCGVRLEPSKPLSRRHTRAFLHPEQEPRCFGESVILYEDDAERIAAWNRRARIALPTADGAQQPVAFRYRPANDPRQWDYWDERQPCPSDWFEQPLYASPPAQPAANGAGEPSDLVERLTGRARWYDDAHPGTVKTPQLLREAASALAAYQARVLALDTITDDEIAEAAALTAENEAARNERQTAWAALRMVREAIGELFGPAASIESEDAVLLRGPEYHHEAAAIITSLQKVEASNSDRLKALNQAETVMMMVSPRSHTKEYLECLAEIRGALSGHGK